MALDWRLTAHTVTNQAAEKVALSRAWVLDTLMRHAQVCLGEIPLRLKMRKARSMDGTELETHLPNLNAANRSLEVLGRELNLFTEKKEVGKQGDFDHMADEELTEFIEAKGELVRELECQLLSPQSRAAQACYQALGKFRSLTVCPTCAGQGKCGARVRDRTSAHEGSRD